MACGDPCEHGASRRHGRGFCGAVGAALVSGVCGAVEVSGVWAGSGVGVGGGAWMRGPAEGSVNAGAGGYAFDNGSVSAHRTLALLSQILDPFTVLRLSFAVRLWSARCWDIGAGNGSLAAELTQEMGRDGVVYASDIDPRYVTEHWKVEVLRHDVRVDAPPAAPLDLIHGRLVFPHLPERDEIVGRLAGVVAPGGVVATTDFEPLSGRVVQARDRVSANRLFIAYQEAMLAMLVGRGLDPMWVDRAPDVMRAAGLEVNTAVSAQSWRSGEAGCLLPAVMMTEYGDRLVAAGMAVDDLADLAQVLADPDTVILGQRIHSTVGRRRETGRRR